MRHSGLLKVFRQLNDGTITGFQNNSELCELQKGKARNRQMSLEATAEVLESKEAWTEGLDSKDGAETRDIQQTCQVRINNHINAEI